LALCGITVGSVLGLFWKLKLRLGFLVISFEFAFYCYYSIDIFLQLHPSIASLEKSESSVDCFYRTIVFLAMVLIFCMVMMDIFPIHQDIVDATLPVEDMVATDGGFNHTTSNCQRFYELLSRKVCRLDHFLLLIGFSSLKSAERGEF
jgi:hypothetical protein